MTYERKSDVVVGTFPQCQPDGVTFIQVEVCTEVDTLTYRNRKGRLVGIVSRFPAEIMFGGAVLEAKGNVSLWVDPTRRRRGIGMLMIAEVDRRWSPDWSARTYTAGGHALITKYLTETQVGGTS